MLPSVCWKRYFKLFFWITVENIWTNLHCTSTFKLNSSYNYSIFVYFHVKHIDKGTSFFKLPYNFINIFTQKTVYWFHYLQQNTKNSRLASTSGNKTLVILGCFLLIGMHEAYNVGIWLSWRKFLMNLSFRTNCTPLVWTSRKSIESTSTKTRWFARSEVVRAGSRRTRIIARSPVISVSNLHFHNAKFYNFTVYIKSQKENISCQKSSSINLSKIIFERFRPLE